MRGLFAPAAQLEPQQRTRRPTNAFGRSPGTVVLTIRWLKQSIEWLRRCLDAPVAAGLEPPFVRRLRRHLAWISAIATFNAACLNGAVAMQLASSIWFLHVALLLVLSCSIVISCESPSRPPLFGLHFPAASSMHGLVACWLLHVGLLSVQASFDPGAGRLASLEVDNLFAFNMVSLGVLWGVLMPCGPRTRWCYLVVLCACATSEAIQHSQLLHGHILFWLFRGPVTLLVCALLSHGVACTALRHHLEREEVMGDIRRTLDENGPMPDLVDAEMIARDWADGPLADISALSILICLVMFLVYQLSWMLVGGNAGPVSDSAFSTKALAQSSLVAGIFAVSQVIVIRAPYGTRRRKWAIRAVACIALCLTLVRSCMIIYTVSTCFSSPDGCRVPMYLFPAAAQVAPTCTPDFTVDSALPGSSRPSLI